MGVVLLILKILGITILCILGLVLLILALVLFVPIRYRAEGSIESKEKHAGIVNVHWLLHAIDVKIIDDPETKTISKRIRILGLFGKKMDSVIFPSAKDDDEEDTENEEASAGGDTKPEETAISGEAKPEESTAAGETEPAGDGNEGAAGKPEQKEESTLQVHKPEHKEDVVAQADKPEKPAEDKKEESGSKPAENKEDEAGSKPAEDKEDKPEGDTAKDEEVAGGKPKKRSIGERIEDLKETVSCVLELFSRRKDLLKEYLTKKSTKAAVGKLWKTALWLLKTIAPRKGHAEVTFGLKDPEMTGKAFAAAAALYPWYGRHIDLYPDFTQEKIEGEGSIRGRLRLWGVAIRALSILFDKNIKKVRREFEKVKDKMTSTPAEIKKIIKKEDAA